MEIEKKIENYDGYTVTDTGKVYSYKLGRKIEMKIQVNLDGYGRVMLYNIKGARGKRFYVHRIVAEAFIGKPSDKEEINHIDNNRLNNKLDNLEWCSRSKNAHHKYKTYKHQKGVSYNKSKLTELEATKIKFYLKNNIPVVRISKKMEVSRSTIYNIKRNDSWKHLEV